MLPDPDDKTPWLAGSVARALAASSFVAGMALSVVASHRELFPGEVATTKWLVANVEPWIAPLTSVLDDTFTDMTATVVFAGLLVTVLLSWGWWEASAFLVAGAFTALARLGNLVQRPRPTGRLAWGTVVEGGGYPSGHVVYFVLVFGMLAFFVWQLPSRLPRRTTVGVLAAGIALVGAARIVELDHWPIDVVGAYLLAFPALVVTVSLYRLGPPPSQSGRFG